MKKILTIILALSLIFALCACGGVELPPLPEVTPRPEATEAPAEAPQAEPEPAAEPEVPVEEPEADQPALANRVTVNFINTTKEAYDPEEGKTLILNFSYDTPNVRIQDRDEAAEKINETFAVMDETFYTGQEYEEGYSTGYNNMLMQAEDNYTYAKEAGIELPMEYSSTRSVRILRADDRLLTALFEYYDYTGGAHGNYSDEACMFDTQTGEKIGMDQLTGDVASLSAFLVEKMMDQAKNDEMISQSLYPDQEDDELKEALTALLRDGSWYLDDAGLVVFSDPYEIGPYASGIISFRIPYAELQGKIDEKWFPGEKSGSGSLSAQAMSEVVEGTVEILDRVAVSENGVEICLAVKGTIYDVQLSKVQYIDYTGAFSEDSRLWYSSYMQNSALQISAVVPEGIPDLMIRYTTGDGEVHRQLLSQSGLDGSFLLVDDTIAAVG